jgi:hypothetical protein
MVAKRLLHIQVWTSAFAGEQKNWFTRLPCAPHKNVLHLFLFDVRNSPFCPERIPMTSTAPCKPAAAFRTDAPRVDGWTPQRQALFLMSLAQTGNVSRACEVAEMSTMSAYGLRREPRGMAFNLGWQAANLMARDVLEDILLEAAIEGVESISERIDGITHRRALNTGMSMAVLNRLDRRLASLDDQAAAVSRTIGAAFDDFIALILAGGGAPEIADFLESHADPLAAQVVNAASAKPASKHKLPEESAIFYQAQARNEAAPIPVILSAPTPEPCACPADRDLALLEPA